MTNDNHNKPYDYAAHDKAYAEIGAFLKSLMSPGIHPAQYVVDALLRHAAALRVASGAPSTEDWTVFKKFGSCVDAERRIQNRMD